MPCADGGLEGDVGLLIVRVGCRPRERCLQAGEVAQLVAGFGVGTSEDLSVETDNVLRLEVDGLFSSVREPLTSSVVRLEEPKRFTILCDDFAPNAANPCPDPVRRSNKQLTRRQFLYKDLAVRAIAKSFDPMREGHDVAVADSPDLNDLHTASIHAYIRHVKRYRAEGDGWASWSGLATLLAHVEKTIAKLDRLVPGCLRFSQRDAPRYATGTDSGEERVT